MTLSYHKIFFHSHQQSHAFQSAKWKGTCNYMMSHLDNGDMKAESRINLITPSAASTSICGRSQFMTSDLRNRLEKLEIKS